MLQATYIYGDDFNANVLSEMQYKEAISQKISWSEVLITRLLREDYKTRDIERITKSLESQKFNRSLLTELTGYLNDS